MIVFLKRNIRIGRITDSCCKHKIYLKQFFIFYLKKKQRIKTKNKKLKQKEKKKEKTYQENKSGFLKLSIGFITLKYFTLKMSIIK